MENKINIAEILEGCPQGLKLYSPIFGNVYLSGIRPHLGVIVKTSNNQKEEFLYDGRFGINGECMLFPSNENRDWSTFKRPFKDGDIVVTTLGNIAIISEHIKKELFYTHALLVGDKFYNDENTEVVVERLATEEEKQKLFDAIKANGYKWNDKTKTLEKLVEPKFKVGDKISKCGSASVYVITNSNNGKYLLDDKDISVSWDKQDDWELVPAKFDITTLKPFDKVLVRDNNEQKWTVDMFSFYDKNLIYPFACVGYYTNKCIPYEQNKHLLGTTDDCDEFYKTWEK